MNNSIQIAILIFSGLAALLVSSRNPRTRMCGFIAGLCGQPFWFVTSWTNGQWAILLLSGFYTFCHLRGFIGARKDIAEKRYKLPYVDEVAERLIEEPLQE